jgi:hypothetical protein
MSQRSSEPIVPRAPPEPSFAGAMFASWKIVHDDLFQDDIKS